MIPFLKQVADHYYIKGGISDRCFIFPNRRSMVFFSKYLGDAVVKGGEPIVAPQMMTVNDLFYKMTRSKSIDKVRLLIELYESYKELNPKAESLDEFIFWGDIILADFNDVDKYLVNPKQLFANVSDLKQIQDTFSYLTETQRRAIEAFVSNFSDNAGRLTVDLHTENPDIKGRFLLIWNILYELYVNFNRALSAKGMAYEGMVYRKLVKMIDENPAEDVFTSVLPDIGSIVFVGLNALNECEKKVLGKLRDAQMAEFCWDYSGDMIRDPKNRSSFFMSGNVAEFPQALDCDPEGVGVPQFNVVGSASSVGQAKRLPDVLKIIADESTGGDPAKIDMLDCAIVLPDEGLLVPVLNSIPESVADINVTMGLPMTGSQFYSIMSDIASCQLHSINRRGNIFFYHKQVWNIFSNALFRKAADEKTMERVSRIKAEQKYYIPRKDLSGTPLLDVLFNPVITDMKSNSSKQIRDFAEYQKLVILSLTSAAAADTTLCLELEYAKEYFRCVNILDEISLEILPITYVKLLGQLLASVSVPFKGEPLKGLQIMGPLETRCLDFKNIIILSANEGTFPRRNVSSSFIPPELRKGFGLPTYEYQDSVWAYYFYRMISRAENVWMFTDTRTEGLKSGEESRYIKQLEYHFNVPLNRYVVRFDKMKTAQVDEIEKHPEDVAKIRSSILSATTLQNYLACPAKFYYGVVKGLKTEDEVTESLDYGMFGTIYHETMRSLYTCDQAMEENFFFDHKGENEMALGSTMTHVTADYIKSWISREDDIRQKIKSLIIRELSVMDVSGRNLVVTDVILKYVIKTLQRDLELLSAEGVDSFEVLGREVGVFGEFAGQRFKGYIDRMDSFHPGQVRIVDYKTGKVLDDDENITDDNAEAIADKIFAADVKDRPKIALQFFIYDILVQNHPLVKDKDIYNCVYSPSRLFKDPPSNVRCNAKFIEEISRRLKDTLEEMYSLEKPFRRTEDRKVCEYCDFKMICGR